MKLAIRIALLVLTALNAAASGTDNKTKIEEAIVYTDMATFPRLGQAVDESQLEGVYDRLPAALKDSIRPDLWNLGKNSAGVAIRFRSDAKKLKARWEVLNNFWMNHMTPTGIKGLDLYALDDDGWMFVGSARPGHQKATFESTFISNMDGSMREYMLFLPLYDGATKVEIGVNEGAVVEMPQSEFPIMEKPVIVYGTSVTQGGCATRPGMAYPAILMRHMNREFINLGFSGNGRLDPEIAALMADTPASLFILDHMGNCTADMLDRLEPFVEILRSKQPETPILLLGNHHYTYERYDLKTQADSKEKKERLEAIYNKLRENDKNIYYLPADDLIGLDEEGTVDGTHQTDLGFLRMATSIQPLLESLINP